MVPICLSAHQVPFEKGSILKRKNVLPGSTFFPFRVDPFSEWDKNSLDRVVSPENVSIPLNEWEHLG